jgi:hypothetical protein
MKTNGRLRFDAVNIYIYIYIWSPTPCASPPPRPSIFPIILFGSTTLLTRMTDNSLHMQWPLTSQSHGSVSQREQLFFCYGSNSTPNAGNIYLYFDLSIQQ